MVHYCRSISFTAAHLCLFRLDGVPVVVRLARISKDLGPARFVGVVTHGFLSVIIAIGTRASKVILGSQTSLFGVRFLVHFAAGSVRIGLEVGMTQVLSTNAVLGQQDNR